MLLSHIYQQKILSREFITKQLSFEKKMYSLIAQNCTPPQNQTPEQSTINYHECAKSYKQKIKHFGLITELLIQQRTRVTNLQMKELKNEIKQKCLKSAVEDQILNCVNKITKNTILDHFQQDFEFLDISREEILKNSNKKKN